MEVLYSNIINGWPGIGNIDANPLFVDHDNNDFHLLPGSPCINSATPNRCPAAWLDMDGETRTMGGRLDMGVDEFTDVPTVPVIGDINCDCEVNALDIEAFIAALFEPWNYSTRYPHCDINLADFNGNGWIDGGDIEGFINLLFP